MRRIALIVALLGALLWAGPALAQTTTFNGVVKDLTNTPVPTGQVSFALKPSIDTTTSGSSRFVPTTTFCEIHNPAVVSTSGTGTITVVVGTAQNWQVGDVLIFNGTADPSLNNTVATAYAITGVNSTTSFNFSLAGTHTNGAGGTVGGLYASGGTGACNVTQNTALQPAGTSYNVSLMPIFSLTSSFNTYAIGAGPVDISTVVPTPGQMPAYSFVDLFSNQTITGNKTVSGNWIYTGNSIFNNSGTGLFTFSNHNGIVWAGSGTAYKYTTLEGALAAAECSPNGCRYEYATGFQENLSCTSSSISIGSSTGMPRYLIHAQPDVKLTATGAGGSLPCLILKEGTGFEGPVTGSSSTRTGGFVFSEGRTGSVGPFLQTDLTEATGESYFMLRNIFMSGSTTPTVSPAAIDIEQLLNQSVFENIKVCCYANTYELQFTSGPLHELGPIVLQNYWSDCGYNTGCQNFRAKVGTSSGPQSVLPIDILGGNQSGVGPNGAFITFDGSLGSQARVQRGMRVHTYIDNSGGSSSNAAIGIKAIDITDLDASGTVFNLQDTDTAVDLSETAAQRLAAIHLGPSVQSSPTNLAKLVSNHVSGVILTGASLPFYNFGCENFAGLCAPATFDMNITQWTNSAAKPFFTIDWTATAATIRNFADTAMRHAFILDSGSTATQQLSFDFRDRGTTKWEWLKQGDNSFLLLNTASGGNRIKLPDNVPVSNAVGYNLGNTEHIAWRDSANGSDHALGEVQHIRGVAGCTTAASIGGICATATTVTWPSPFADTNYTATCWATGTATNVPGAPFQVSKVAASVTINYFAITAAAASWSAIDCVAVHD